MLEKTKFTEEELTQVQSVKDALDNLRTHAQLFDAGKEVSKEETLKLTDRILEEIVPLAERLGMYSAQKEMQETCVRIAYPEDYKKLRKLLQDAEASCEMVFKTFSLPIRAMLDDLNIEYDFQYRMKSVYSIWRKMRNDHKEFDDVFDLFATRIIYKTPDAAEPLSPTDPRGEEISDRINMEKLYCWRIYNVIAMLYRIHPDRIKDWVTNPKPSGYQALQMTVMGPDCNWVEIQIRSERMDYEAEYGVAAHWKYKEETKAK